jgi:hypothetical protein
VAAAEERQLSGFIRRYPPAIASLGQAVLNKMRERLPGAVQMVYDNYNALVVGFGPTERASDAVFSIALYPRWVNLFFLKGSTIPDPQKLLDGKGTQVRSLRLDDVAALDAAPVRALMAAALRQAKPIDPAAPARLIIKSISAKQRPRRPPRAAPRKTRG